MPADALRELLARIGANNGTAVLVSEEELKRWPARAVDALKLQRLLAKASPAASVVCPGCEQECAMPIYADSGASFVVCDKRDDINRVQISADRLRQWSSSMGPVSAFVARSLGLSEWEKRNIDAGLWEIGIVTGKKRSQMVCLRADGELQLVVAGNSLPLDELVSYGTEGYSIDIAPIQQLVDAANTGDSRYTPSNAKREARKLKTQSVYARWRREYRAWQKRRPEMSDVWYCQQIAKMAIAKGRSAETIRKHIKR